MRKQLFLLLLLLGGLKASAQQYNRYPSEHYLGINGGATFSSIRFSPTIRQTMKEGMSGGITFRYIGEKYMGLQAELNYTQAGWREEQNNINPLSYSRTLNYLELPFMTHVYFNAGKARIFVNLGPKVAFFLGDSEQSDYPVDDKKARGKQVQNKVDYGICGGLGAEYRTPIGTFGIDGRYYFGLGDIFKNSKKDPFGSSANQVISASAYYLIPFLKKGTRK